MFSFADHDSKMIYEKINSNSIDSFKTMLDSRMGSLGWI